MKGCDRDGVKAWVERTLDGERVAEIEDHARSCSSCRRYARRLRRSEAALIAALGRSDAGPCPDPIVLAASVGSLESKLEEHLAACEECRQVAAAISAPRDDDADAITRLGVVAARVGQTLAPPALTKSGRSRRTQTSRILTLQPRRRSVLPWLVPALAAGLAIAVGLSISHEPESPSVARAPDAPPAKEPEPRSTPTAPKPAPAAPKPAPAPRVVETPARPEPEVPAAPAEAPAPVEPAPAEPAPEPAPEAPRPRSTEQEPAKPAPAPAPPAPSPKKSDEPAKPAQPAGPVLAATLQGGLDRKRGAETVFASIRGDVGLGIGDVLRARGEARLSIKDRLAVRFEPLAQLTVIDFAPQSIRLGLDDGAVELDVAEHVRNTEIVALDELVVKPWGGSGVRAELREDGLHVSVVKGKARLENSRGYVFLEAGESMILKKNVPPRVPLHRGR
jgi:hypothetical protein